jgi:L-methionine (R)-S-oxide reductase
MNATSPKATQYAAAMQQIELLTDGETDQIAVLSTIACELFHAFDYFNWVGFYRRTGDTTLKVGPYQGSHGCLAIDIAQGVCGKCVREARIQIENDVTSVPFHIACSSTTQAEIVLPIFDTAGAVWAVLDVDSGRRDVFDNTDVHFLSMICCLAYRGTA